MKIRIIGFVGWIMAFVIFDIEMIYDSYNINPMLIKEILYVDETLDKSDIAIVYKNTMDKGSIYRSANESKATFEAKISGKWHQVKVDAKSIEFNEKHANTIIDLIYKQHEIIPNIKTSNPEEIDVYGVKFEGKVESVVNSLIQSCSYNKVGIFDFVSLLLLRLTNAHAFHNGNKRTAVVSISKLLLLYGYYMKWSIDKQTYIKKWENFMLDIASLGNHNYDEQKEVNKIKNQLLKYIWIDTRDLLKNIEK